MKKNITIIVPAFNCEKTICRCIDSILEQLSDDDCLIVVDDASQDDTLQILKNKYTDERIKIFSNKKNKGVSYTRNKGLLNTDTQLVTFVDGDDFISSGYIEFIKHNFSDKTELLLTGLNYINEADNITTNLLPKKYNKSFKEIILSLDMQGLMSSSCNKVFLTNYIKQEKIFFNEKAKIMEDYEFNINYCSHIKKIDVFEKSYYNYVFNSSSASSSYKHKLFERYEEIKNIRYNFYNGNNDMHNLNFSFMLFCISNLYKKNNILSIKQRKEELKLIIYSDDFKLWKENGIKKNIVSKVIYFSTLTNNISLSDFILNMLHHLKNKINFINIIFRKLNGRKR